ncbi:MAG: Group-specific protein [Lachnoclostridium sp.]|jgi:hypothetical protein
MKKLYLEGTKTLILDDNKQVKLDYYLVEDLRNRGQEISLYGIKIVKHLDDYLETEYTEPISYSREIVKEMVRKLWVNGVTITTMLEIVDDLVSEYC